MHQWVGAGHIGGYTDPGEAYMFGVCCLVLDDLSSFPCIRYPGENVEVFKDS